MPTIAEVRKKYPQYGDLSDQALADALHSKFYADLPKQDFYGKVGLSAPAAAPAAPVAAAPAKRPMSAGAPTKPLAGAGGDDIGSRLLQIGDQMVRTYAGAAGDLADGITGIINRPANAVMDAVGVDPKFRIPVDQIGTKIAQPEGLGGQAARVLAPFLTGSGAVTRAATALAPEAAVAATGLVRGAQAAREAQLAARAAPAISTPIRAGIVGGAPIDVAMSSQQDSNLSNLVAELGGPTLPTARVKGENEGIAAVKDLVEGGVVGGLLEKTLSYFTRGARARPGTPEAVIEEAEVEQAMLDPAIRAQLDASGIGETNPKFQVFAARAQARQAEQAARNADPFATAEPGSFRPPLRAEGAPPPSPAEIAGARVDQTVQYRDDLRAGAADLEARTRLDPADPAYVNPAYADPRTLPPAGSSILDKYEPDGAGGWRRIPEPEDMRVTPQGQAFKPTDGALRGQDLRKPSNLPVPVDPPTPRMSDADIAQARRANEAGNPNRETGPGDLRAPEGRAPQTRDDVAAQRDAGDAFDLAQRQRERVAPEVRDTQTAGLPEGPKPQRVTLDEGFPVRVVQEGKGGAIEVERYDPRTGIREEGSTRYWTTRGNLDETNYTPEPRRAQDFNARDNPARTSPELPRDAGPGAPAREPTQTFRATDNQTPNDGGPPFPEQAAGPMPGQDAPRRESAQRFADEAAAEAEFKARQEEKPRWTAEDNTGKTSSTAREPDADGRFATTNTGKVLSDKGGPIKFGDQKQAGKWIINVGQKRSPDQIFQIANRPGGGFTVEEIGRGGGPTPEAGPVKETPKTEQVDPAPVKETGNTEQIAGPAPKDDGEERAAFRAMAKGFADNAARDAKVKADGFADPHVEAASKAKTLSEDELDAATKAAGDARKEAGEARTSTPELREKLTSAHNTLLDESRARSKARMSEIDARLDAFEAKRAEAKAKPAPKPEPKAPAKGEAMSDADADAMYKKVFGGGNGGAKGGTKLYSNPLDPDAIKELLIDPAVRVIKKEIDGFRTDLASVGKDLKGLKDSVSVGALLHGAATVVRKVWWTNTAAIRAVAAKYPDVPEIRALADLIGTDPGRGRVVGQTYERASQMRAMSMANRLMNMLGEKTDAAFDARVADILSGNKRAVGGSPEEAAARRLRALLDEQHTYLTAAGLETGYVKGRYYPRVLDDQAVLKKPAEFKAAAAKLYRSMGLGAEDAARGADEWYDRVLGVKPGGYASGLPSSKATKGRTLPPDAEKYLDGFYEKDPRANLTAYFRQTSRAAEFTRSFGKNGEKVQDLFDAMLKKGVPANDVNNLKHHFDSAAGLLYSTRADAGASALSWIQTAGVLRLLPRAVISSAAEGLAVGIRAHDVGAGFKAMRDSYGILFGLDDAADVKQTAEFLGIVGDAMNDLVLSANFGGEVTGLAQQKLLTRFFKTTGLHQITEAQRLAATRVGQGMIRTLLQDVGQGTKRQASATRLLAELGMDAPGAKAVSTWLESNGGSPRMSDLMGEKPEAKMYRTALQRFVDESIQNPTAADRPQWANHPYGRLAYGVTSFMFSFTRNVLIRTGRETAEGIFGKGYTLEDRARLLTPAVALGVLTAAQGQVSELRDATLNPGSRAERSDTQNTVTSLSRAGAFGNLDPFVNIAMSARYNRDLTSTLTGPYLTAYLDSFSKMTVGLLPKSLGGPNTPNTNNAEWQASKAAYEMIAAPLIAAAASYAPGGPILRVGYGAGMIAATSPGVSRKVADTAAGERTVKPKAKEEPAGGTVAAPEDGLSIPDLAL